MASARWSSVTIHRMFGCSSAAEATVGAMALSIAAVAMVTLLVCIFSRMLAVDSCNIAIFFCVTAKFIS